MSDASSVSPSAFGSVHSATRLVDAGVFDCHPDGAVNFSVAAGEPGEIRSSTAVLRMSSMGSILAEDMRAHFLPRPRGVSRIGIWMKQPVDANQTTDERRHTLAAIPRERSEHLIFAFRHPHVHLTLFHLRALRLYA